MSAEHETPNPHTQTPSASGTGEAAAEAAVSEPEAEVLDAEVLEPEPEAPVAPPTPEEEAQRYLALAQRTQADFDNFRKRAARDAAAAGERGKARLAKELLPALDHLELALQAGEQDPAAAEFAKGLRLVQDELAKALGRAGIETYSPRGERFDPEQHEAMAQHAVEGTESGTVVEVYQAGYRLNGSVLRPARVVVAA
jgi:molecular chaperone GrpE